MCDENLYGVVSVVEYIKFDEESKNELLEEKSFLGYLISGIKDGFKISYINAEPKLYESTYLCTFQIEARLISNIYKVIHKRRGEVRIIF